jgi:two-component system, LytTR family, response regulator
MDRIKTLIIDDEKPARRALRGLLEQDRDIEVAGEAADGEQALELVSQLRPQLIFLDVQMPMLTGLEVVARLPRAGRPEIVFVTAYDDHALAAFDAHAVDYLVKPFTDARFATAVWRAKQRLRDGQLGTAEQTLRELLAHFQQAGGVKSAPAVPAHEHARLVVKADGQLHFINQGDIRWVEGQGDFIKLHLKERGRLLVRMTMNKAEAALDPARFVRIHKSTIVSFAAVRRVVPMLARSRGMELDDGTRLAIGPSYRAVLDRLK